MRRRTTSNQEPDEISSGFLPQMSAASRNRIADLMQKQSLQNLSWPKLLAALRTCSGDSVLIRDGNLTEPASSVRIRPSAKGTELCLFSGESAMKRLDLIEQLEIRAKGAGRRFMAPARAMVNGSTLIVESVTDETVDSVLFAVIRTRRRTLGFNQSQQKGDTTTFRNKRIKNG